MYQKLTKMTATYLQQCVPIFSYLIYAVEIGNRALKLLLNCSSMTRCLLNKHVEIFTEI